MQASLGESDTSVPAQMADEPARAVLPRTFHTTKEILFVKLSDGDDELVSQLRDG